MRSSRLWWRRLLGVVVGACSAIVFAVVAPLLTATCCEHTPAEAQRVVVLVFIVAAFGLASLIGSLTASQQDPWPALVLTIVVVTLALLGLAFSAVESGRLASAANLSLAIGGSIAIWSGYGLAHRLRRFVSRHA